MQICQIFDEMFRGQNLANFAPCEYKDITE